MNEERRSIASQAAIRLILSLGVLVIFIGCSTAAIYRSALDKAAQERGSDMKTFYASRLTRLEREWAALAHDMRVRIENTRILEQSQQLTENLQAYFTIQGGEQAYQALHIVNAEDQLIFAFGNEALQVPTPSLPAQDNFWSLQGGGLYRVFVEDIWLGLHRLGKVYFYFRINHALLGDLAMQGIRLAVLHGVNRVASSVGSWGLRHLGDTDHLHHLPWGKAGNEPIQLEIEAPVNGLFSKTELVIGTSLVPLVDALLLWLVLGTWLMYNATRIKQLGMAVRQYTLNPQGNPSEVQAYLHPAKGRQLDEIAEVALTLEEMMTHLQQYKQQLQVLSQVFHCSSEPMLLTGADKNILLVNRAFEKKLGYTLQEVEGQNPRFLASSKHDARFYAEVWTHIDAHGGWTGEMWNCDRNGNSRPFLNTISVIRDDQGNITHYISCLADLTELVAARQQRE